MAGKGWTVASTNVRVAPGAGFSRAATYRPAVRPAKADADGDPFVAFTEWLEPADEAAWRDL